MSDKCETDLCDFGGDTIILYSEDEQIFQEFAKHPNCVRSKGYMGDGTFLGGDCYFRRSYKKELKQILKRRGLIK